ncbi:hypothetical protein Ahy_B06g084616 [Arachis hypogaea]|uniref:Uncharacterized protein n=1 Tax=Arachis hypogaea TaxID=3818 RepID=A0A444YSE0_ARAHY|nr:hypothetical protein Ahy_B06g084616 [Arachis hypogaea]
MMFRATKKAKDVIEGTKREQYLMLRTYLNELHKDNLGSTCHIAPCQPKKMMEFQRDRIHASISKSVVAWWWGNIFEFQMYVMRNFIVADNKSKPKTTNSNWKLILFQRTTVKHVNNPRYPLEAFRFKSISDLLNAERLDDIYLFDMIAKVVEKEDPMNLVTSKIRKPNVWLLC